jgi:DNA-binding HxlR family transcriptional regulator
MAKRIRRSDCPISTALDIFGDKWTLLIIRDLMFKGKHNYGEFLNSEEEIATNILADRLSLLETEGIVLKMPDPSHGLKYIYRLTKKGIDLLPLLVDIIVWSAKYDALTAVDKAFVERARTDRDGLLKEISAGLNAEQFK